MIDPLRPGAAREPTIDALLAGSVVGLGFLSTDLRYIRGNDALAKALGVASLIGLGPADLDAAGSRTEVLLRKVLRTGRPITLGTQARRVKYNRVLDDEGVPLGLSAVSTPDSPVDLDLARWKLEAETDGLTGLVNHRVFQERLQSEVTRSRRHNRPLSLAMIDIDGFKQLNDAFGHQVGDGVLSTVARHLAASVRANDTVARIGGDEFALLLPETDAAAAVLVAERVHDRLRRDTSNPGTTITLSTGLCDMQYASSADDLIRFADGALFWTKGHGRERHLPLHARHGRGPLRRATRRPPAPQQGTGRVQVARAGRRREGPFDAPAFRTGRQPRRSPSRGTRLEARPGRDAARGRADPRRRQNRRAEGDSSQTRPPHAR